MLFIKVFMNKRWKSTAHIVYNCSYHIIWVSKYRKKVLTGAIEDRLKQLLIQKSTEHEWTIERMEVMPDHVHVFIKVTPNDSAVYVASQLKGFTSFMLRSEFKELRTRLPTLWTRSFYCETIGHISEDVIKKYIEDQKTKEPYIPRLKKGGFTADKS
jgi:putative transposase